MNRAFTLFLVLIFASWGVRAQFTTPGTSVSWTLDSLVSHSAGAVIHVGTHYEITANLTISATDTIKVVSDELIKFHDGTTIESSGTLLLNPPTLVTLTALDSLSSATKWRGLRLDETSYTVINNARIEFGGGVKKLSTGYLAISNSTFRKNYYKSGSSTGSQASGGVIDFSGKVSVTHSRFIENQRSAISSGANIYSSAIFKYNYLFGNTNENSNRPQINLGPSGVSDTSFIIGNTVIGNGKILVGGIAVSSLLAAETNTVIDSNIVRNNRYGIALTGSKITSFIRHNTIENNNIQNNPDLGGSGINLTSSSSGSWQNSTITGNTITGNLWGVTIVGYPTVNMGDTSAQTFNPGMNVFSGNGNNGIKYDLYNNGSQIQYAMGNCWDVTVQDSTSIEAVVTHSVDNSNYGRVYFTPAGSCGTPLPIEFTVTTLGGAPIENASITIGGETLYTNAIGKVVFNRENGSYSYLIEKSDFVSATGSFLVFSAPKSIVVKMAEVSPSLYPLTFLVKDELGAPIANAEISITGQPGLLFTFTNGQVTTQIASGTHNFSVTKPGYITYSGTVQVAQTAQTVEVTLLKVVETYQVKFIVSAFGSLSANASIQINNETINTDINGEATIDLPNGTYPYAVSAPTTQIINGEVIVNGENQVVQIDLSVGINESHSSDVNIYPVPVTSILNINKKGYVAQIIDMTGSVVYNSNVQTTQIDMRSLPAGRYIIRLINKKEVITKTITKL